MKWTIENPAVAGWFFYKRTYRDAPSIHRVGLPHGADRLMIQDDDYDWNDFTEGFYAGPIPEPED